MADLLDKIRELNRLVPKSTEIMGDFSPMLEALGQTLGSNVYLAALDGTLLGRGVVAEPDCARLEYDEAPRLSPAFQARLAFSAQTVANLPLEGCPFHEGGCPVPSGTMSVLPVKSGNERLGNLLLLKREGEVAEEDLMVAEAGAVVIALAVLHHQIERSEADARQKANAQVALDSLSFSELRAAAHVFEELGGSEGFLVASKIADRIGITRSVIVNAMRKLESGGVVETRSLGMKGTYIRIQNPFLLDELVRRTRARGLQ
ncbi:MAG: GTP-sensing pleiotropic transcriptional regulator CodY [Firmicutes bacterium]|nr:GTP-sensing pleiotropic transcriptional regulator CodY [Bacillota bacterium]